MRGGIKGSFQEMTGCDAETAKKMLTEAGFDINRALDEFAKKSVKTDAKKLEKMFESYDGEELREGERGRRERRGLKDEQIRRKESSRTWRWRDIVRMWGSTPTTWRFCTCASR